MGNIASYCEFIAQRLNLMIEMAAIRTPQDLMMIHEAMDTIQNHRWPDDVVASFDATENEKELMRYFIDMASVASLSILTLKMKKEGAPKKNKSELSYDPSTGVVAINSIGFSVRLSDYSVKKFADQTYRTFKDATKSA